MSSKPPTSPSTSNSRSGSRPGSGVVDRDTAPPGIKIICIIGWLGALFAFFVGLGLLGVGGIGALLGVFLLLISVGQAVVFVGLWGLRNWAWKWTLILEGIGIVLQLYQTNVVGVLIGLVVFGYVFSKADLYEP